MDRGSQVVEIATRRMFEAAHYLPNLPDGHKCKRMHGHNYVVEVVLRAPIDPLIGMAWDYAVLDGHIDALIVNACDHRVLNEIEGLENPTGENIAIWAWRQLEITMLPLHEVSVWETPHYRATVRAGDL